MSSTTSKNSSTADYKTPWIILLIQTIIKHWLSLIFVLFIFVLFRMPHLSDLTVVIIELKYHYAVIPVFYATIVVMAVLISYGYLVVDNGTKIRKEKQRLAKQAKTKELTKKSIFTRSKKVVPDAQNDSINKPEAETIDSKTSILKLLKGQLSLQDPKEKKVMADYTAPKESATQTIAIDVEEEYLTVKDEHQESPETNDGNTTDETPLRYMDRVFPKFLATFMILSIAFSVNNTIGELYGNTFVSPLLLWIVLIIFTVLTHKGISDYIKTQLRWKSYSFKIPASIIVVGFLAIVLFGVINQGGTPRDIRFLFISIFLLAVLFFTLNVTYNKKLLEWKADYIEPLVLICFCLSLLCYVFMFFLPSSPLNKLTPMVILMLCLIAMYVIFSLFKYWGARTGWPVLTMVFFGAIMLTILFAKNSSFRHYEVTNTTSKHAAADRMDLETYVDLWIEKRANAIAAASVEERFPIILVSAEGGGSRAGHWALLVHSYLYEHSEAYFKDHLFSITGASGGSVGSNIFYSQAYERHNTTYVDTLFRSNSEEGYQYRASDFYQNDYISSSIAGLLGRDLFASITNFSFFKDRGALTESEWETSFDASFKSSGLLQRSYLDIMPKVDDTFIPPLMVTTTTHVQSGAQYIMSPVKFQPNNHNEMVFKDLLAEYQAVYPNDVMIKRSTGMLLTARFPYLSPNGRITGVGQFGDGGYYDNMGGIVTRRLEQALIRGLNKVDTLKHKYKIKHLIIKNSTEPHLDACSNTTCQCPEAATYNSQLLTPALMVINATFAPADEFVASYPADYRVESKRTLIPIDTSNKDSLDTICDNLYRPLIPLGRYMSKASVLSLEARLKDDEVKNKLERLLRFE